LAYCTFSSDCTHLAYCTFSIDCTFGLLHDVNCSAYTRLTEVACKDAAVAKAARLQHKQQLGEKGFQLIDGATLDCCGLKATLYQAPPHGLQPACTL